MALKPLKQIQSSPIFRVALLEVNVSPDTFVTVHL